MNEDLIKQLEAELHIADVKRCEASVEYDKIHNNVLELATEQIIAERNLALWSNRVRTLTSTIRSLKGEDEEDDIIYLKE